VTRDVADRAWGYLRRALERCEKEGDQAVSITLTRAALRALLESEGRAPAPPGDPS